MTRRGRRWRRRLARGAACAVGVGLLGAGVVPLATYGVREARPAVAVVDPGRTAPGPGLRVMTLNVAHGRGDGANQLFVSTAAIREGLAAVGRFLEAEAPDVVGLQEADGPCFWSGGFDHVRQLAGAGGFGSFVRAENVRGWGLSYGTAVLSRARMSDAVARTFERSWPTFSKGFVVAAVAWPGRELVVDVVSVHLDFASSSVRERQVDEIVAVLSERDRPRIVMGDFNCDLSGEEGTLRRLADALELSVGAPDADVVTFLPDKRIDWILVSPGLRIESHTVHEDVVSDHRAVSAHIALRD